MFNGNWIFKLAVRGCLVGAALLATQALAQEPQDLDLPTLKGQPESESGQNTSKQYGEEGGQKENPPTENLAPALDKIETAIRDFITQQNATQNQGPEDNEISDLEAQKDMAFWAKLMFWTSAAMVIITSIGIALIYGTLIQTGRMLTEAEKTTAAALANVEVTKDTAKRQLRAYITAEPMVERVRSGEKVRMTINATNYGQTPARNVRIRTAVFVRNLPFNLEKERAENAKKPELTERQTIHPTDATYFPHISDFVLPEVAFKMMEEDKAAIFFTGEIYYDDVFDEPHETRFRFEFSGAECFRSGKVRVCKEGNEVTYANAASLGMVPNLPFVNSVQ